MVRIAIQLRRESLRHEIAEPPHSGRRRSAPIAVAAHRPATAPPTREPAHAPRPRLARGRLAGCRLRRLLRLPKENGEHRARIDTTERRERCDDTHCFRPGRQASNIAPLERQDDVHMGIEPQRDLCQRQLQDAPQVTE